MEKTGNAGFQKMMGKNNGNSLDKDLRCGIKPIKISKNRENTLIHLLDEVHCSIFVKIIFHLFSFFEKSCSTGEAYELK